MLEYLKGSKWWWVCPTITNTHTHTQGMGITTIAAAAKTYNCYCKSFIHSFIHTAIFNHIDLLFYG